MSCTSCLGIVLILLIYIKDPFELNLCVTKGFCEEALANWRKHCEATSQITSRLASPATTTSAPASTNDDKGNLLDIIELTIEALPKPNKTFTKVFEDILIEVEVVVVTQCFVTKQLCV